MPTIALPGAIMDAILLTHNNETTSGKQATTTTFITLLVLLTNYLLLLGTRLLPEKIGESGISVISTIMGLLLASFAVQSILSGVKEYFRI